jgi:hypothetical protein
VRAGRFGDLGTRDRRHSRAFGQGGLDRPRPQHGVEQVLCRLCFGDQFLRQPNLEGPLEPQQQLGACEAVEAEIPVEFAVETNGERRTPVRLQFVGKLADDCKDFLRRRFSHRWRRLSHGDPQ